MPFLQHGDYVRFAEDYQPIIDRYLTVSAGNEAPIEIVWNLYDNLYVPGVKRRFQNHPASFLFKSFHLALERSGNPELAKIRATMAMRRFSGGINIYVDSREKRDIILRTTSLWVPRMEWLVRAQIAFVCGQAMYLKAPNAPPMSGPDSQANISNGSSTGVKAKPTPDHLNGQSAVPQQSGPQPQGPPRPPEGPWLKRKRQKLRSQEKASEQYEAWKRALRDDPNARSYKPYM